MGRKRAMVESRRGEERRGANQAAAEREREHTRREFGRVNRRLRGGRSEEAMDGCAACDR